LPHALRIAAEYCLGTACKNCEAASPESVLKLNEAKIMRIEEATA
jgi:ferredoxin